LKPLDPQLLEEINSKIDLHAIADESLIDGNSIQRSARLKKIALFSQLQQKYSHMKYSNSEICDLMNISPSTMSRIRRELDVVSPYRYEKTKTNRTSKPKDKVEPIDKETNTAKSTKRAIKPKGSVKNIPAGDNMYLSSDNEIDDLLKNAGGQYNS
jgi:hypothetical protein